MIAFNEELRETTIDNTMEEIQQLTNQVFSLDNKLENLHSLQSNSQHRQDEMDLQLKQTHSSVEGVRSQLTEFNELLTTIAAKLSEAEETYLVAEKTYNEANSNYNEFNLNVTRQ